MKTERGVILLISLNAVSLAVAPGQLFLNVAAVLGNPAPCSQFSVKKIYVCRWLIS